MKYIEFFKTYTRANEFPKLNREQGQRMLDICYMEGRLSAIDGKDRSKTEVMNEYYREIRSLNELTKRKSPGVLFSEMRRISEKNPD